MKYFILRQDEQFQNGPVLGSWKESMNQNWLCKDDFYKINERQVVSITTTVNTVFPAIITSPYLIVSEKVLSVIRLYGDMALTKDVVLVDSLRQVIKPYFLTLLDEVEAENYDERCEKGTKSTITLKQKGSPLITKNIFIIELSGRKEIIVNLDLAESILRRNAMGICLEEVEILEIAQKE